MIFRAAPAICSAFKGILPSDLLIKYSGPDGIYRMELDLAVSGEISDQLSEVSKKAQDKGKGKANKEDAKGMVARLKQRRAKRLNESEN